MYAVIEFRNKQFLVENDVILSIDRLESSKPGDELVVDKVLLVNKDGSPQVGQPEVKGAKVVCEVIRHMRGKKKIAFKFKKRKDTKVKRGFRADLTEIKVKEIVA